MRAQACRDRSWGEWGHRELVLPQEPTSANQQRSTDPHEPATQVRRVIRDSRCPLGEHAEANDDEDRALIGFDQRLERAL